MKKLLFQNIKCVIYFWSLIFSLYAQKIEKIEPPFWWTEMKHPVLQILLYGDKLSIIDSVYISEAKNIRIKKTGNPRYLLIYLNIENIKPGNHQIKLFKNKKILQTVHYRFHPQPKQKPRGFSSSDVVYLIMPDRFANGNPSNDNHPEMIEKSNRSLQGGRHGGDLEGIIKHLDYLSNLGITALWLTPVLEDNEPVYSYHHYAISNHYRIDPRFGSNEDYKRLATELHNRNMKLIMDYVVNHWGSKHWMIRDLPEKNWIHSWDKEKNGFKRSNYRITTQFDPYVSKADQKSAIEGWFDSTMPDINLNHPDVFQYIWQNAVWWINYAGVDGLRLDTYAYNPKDAINKWVKKIMDEFPSLNIVGEVWMHDQAQMAYWQENSQVGKIQNYISYLPAVMDFTLYDAIKIMFNENNQAWDKGMVRVYENLVNDFLYPEPFHIMVFMGNHDLSRFNEIYDGDLKKYKLALSLILTMRGIPQLYYGDEIGMKGDKSKGDGDIRRDFPGGWPDDTINAFKTEGRTIYQKKFFDFSRKLLQWRKNKRVIHYGKTLHFVPENNVYVFFRYDDDETLMVVLNNSDQKQTLELDRFREILPENIKGEDIISGNKIKLNEKLEIPAKTSYIIELNPKL